MGLHLSIKSATSMKIFVTLMTIVALASAQDNCQRCGQAVQALGNYLLTPSEIAAVEQGLVDLVCTTLPEDNIEGCAKAVYAWWPQMLRLFSNTKELWSPFALALDLVKARILWFTARLTSPVPNATPS